MTKVRRWKETEQANLIVNLAPHFRRSLSDPMSWADN